MGWCQGSRQTRLLIAPHTCSTGNDEGCFLSLKHPKSGNAACYFLINSVLQELHWFKQSYTSWFLGDYICQDGCLYTATPVDPVFILLPIFEEARMKKGDDPGKFRQLDEIVFVNGYPDYQHLISIAENCMQVVCEIKEIGSSKFFRLDDSKVLVWLYCKVSNLKQTLPMIDKNYAALDEKNTLAEAVAILGEYLKDEPWIKLLCNHLKLSLPEASSKVSDTDLTAVESKQVPSDIAQEKSGSDSKTKRKGKQAKKAKVETESRNIKEMFFRASRRS
ncbi:hypothetical protein K2173_003509 [Erythroxylum novogranatense]|uniref:Ribonuclease H2 subunit B n=1 Tax=Erythroxylum novogranatense TaxID=1862640 RepID=A0AAV8TAL6_9ROSI|nr:hypothetical protein K2173_003509 [Erythroxylum novogranatense]